MAIITRLIPHYTQPQKAARLDGKYSRFTHVYNWGAGGILPVNTAKNSYDLINNSSLTITPGRGGKGVTQASGGTNYIGISGNPFATSVCTYLWVESASSLDASGSVIAESRYASDAASESGSLQIRLSATGIDIIKAQTAGILGASNARVAGQINVCAVTINGNNGRHAIFSNGRLLAESTPSVTYVHGTSAIGNGCDADNIQFLGPLYMLAFAPVAIPDADIIRLTANPWQIFQPRKRQIYVSVASGGSVAASSGVAAASGVGASVATTAGASNGAGAASGIGAASTAAAGSSAGSGAASAVGVGATSSVGSSAGSGTASGVGASTVNAVGSSAGVATVSGIAPAEAGSGVGSSSGTATASGVGASIVAAVGSSSGSASVSGVSGNGAVAVPEEITYAPPRKTRAPNFAPRKEPAKPETKKKPKAKAEPKQEPRNRLRMANELIMPDTMLDLMQKRREQQAIERQHLYNIRARAALLAA